MLTIERNLKLTINHTSIIIVGNMITDIFAKKYYGLIVCTVHVSGSNQPVDQE